MTPWLDDLRADARTAIRAMWRAPLFATLVVTVLALGIGAATTVWILVDGIVLRPLSYSDPDRVFTLSEVTPDGSQRPFSYPTFLEYKQRATAFDRLAFARGEDVTLPEAAGSRRVMGAFVSGDFFAALGVPAQYGRTFDGSSADERPIVLSWTLWQQRFGGDPSVIGTPLTTADGSFTIAGVMPSTFAEPAWADTWLPIEVLPQRSRFVLEQRSLHVDAQVTGRLAPGVSREQGEAQLSALAATFATTYPDDAAQWTRVSLTALRDSLLGDAAARLRVLALSVALVLAITALNAAGLLVARHAARGRELAVRTALGARAGRLVRQLVVESAVLSAAGGVAGVVLASFALSAIRLWVPDVFPRLAEVRFDGRAAAFVALAVALVSILIGLLPSRAALRIGLTDALRAGTAGSGETRGQVRLRGALVVLQVALALVVAVSAGLVSRTLTVLAGTSLGVDPDGVTLLRVFPPAGKYETPEEALALYRRLDETLAAVPGVAHTALVNHSPFSGGMMNTPVLTDAPPASDGSDVAVYRTVSPGYLATFGGTMKRGRFVNDDDLRSVGSGLVVNEAFVRRYFPARDALLKTITIFRMAQGRADMGTRIVAPIVGVMSDELLNGATNAAPPAVYVPYTWNAWPNMYVAIRSTLPAATLTPLLRRAVLSVDPAIPVAGSSPQTEFRPLSFYVGLLLANRRVSAWSLSAFSAATLLLAVVGIFGVMAYVVVQRSREIGLRLALGASPGSVSRWVLWRTLRLALLGVALGSLGALAWTRLIRSQLVGVTATDPLTYLSAAALFVAAALLAGLIPAWRASRVDPVKMLRVE
ncbi:MAG: ABC transporter permease [Gemmatimonadota bacterium]